MKTTSMLLAAVAGAMVTIPMTLSPADAHAHWSSRWHHNRSGHGCRTTRADRYIPVSASGAIAAPAAEHSLEHVPG